MFLWLLSFSSAGYNTMWYDSIRYDLSSWWALSEFSFPYRALPNLSLTGWLVASSSYVYVCRWQRHLHRYFPWSTTCMQSRPQDERRGCCIKKKIKEERSVALSVQHYLVLSSDIRTAGMIAETDKLSHPSCLQDSYTATITCNEW